MKTLPLFLSGAALAALLLFPLGFEAGVSLLFAAGFAGIVAADYARPIRRPVSGSLVAVSDRERFRLAA